MQPNVLTTVAGTALLALAAAAARAPSQSTVVLSPEFSGTFFANGHEAVGAEVRVGFSGDYDHPCRGLPVAALVDASGRFAVPAKTAQMSPQELKTIPYGTFQNYVCFDYQGETLVDSMFLTVPNEPFKYIGVCVTPRAQGDGEFLCRWRKGHA